MSDQEGLDQQEQLQSDPYPLYDQWRRLDPVLWLDGIDHWFVTGHQEAMAALRDPVISGTRPDTGGRREALRNALTPAFVDQFRTQFAGVATTLLGKAAEQGTIEMIEDFASPLAISMAAAVLGLAGPHEEILRTWVHEVSATLTPSLGHCGRKPDEDPFTVPEEIRSVLAEAVDARRADPGDDLVSRMLDLEQDELADFCAELVVSAHDGTTGLIGNTVAALIENPGHLERLRNQPELIPTAVEEFLRYDAPVQFVGRQPAENTVVCGTKIAAGERVMIFLGAANRDPDAFENPGELNLSRNPNHHLTFGRGERLCLGAPLARAAGRIALETLSTGYAELAAAGEPTRRTATGARGFIALPSTLRSWG